MKNFTNIGFVLSFILINKKIGKKVAFIIPYVMYEEVLYLIGVWVCMRADVMTPRHLCSSGFFTHTGILIFRHFQRDRARALKNANLPPKRSIDFGKLNK